MFYFTNPLIIGSPLFRLVLFVARGQGTIVVGLSKRIKILTSKKAFWCWSQKPLEAISAQTWSCRFAVASVRYSPDSFCRGGSIITLLDTSVRRWAVVSLTSLCQIAGNPPVGQWRECSTVKEAPQTQFDRSLGGVHPYRRHMASRKAPLCKAKPWVDNWSAVS